MKQVLLILSVLGLCVAETSAAVEISNKTLNYNRTNISTNSYASPQNSYSTNNGGVHTSSSESILKESRQQKIKQQENDKTFRELITQRSQNEYEIVQRNEKEYKRKQKEYERKQKEYERKQELAKKPNIKIGMTKSQVIDNAHWGKPISTMSSGTREGWGYSGKKYLEFTNDRLTKIKE